MADTSVPLFNHTIDPRVTVQQKFVDLGDETYAAAVSIKDKPEPYSVVLTASGSVKSTPGRLHKVWVIAVGTNPTIRLHNGSSASDAALLGTARTVAAVPTTPLWDFGDDGISFDALYFALGVSTMEVVFQVS